MTFFSSSSRRFSGDRVRIFTRSGAEYTERLPRMAQAFSALPASSVVLDGELCYIGADGHAKFYALLREMRTKAPDESALTFYAFDILHERGVSLTGLPLSERRRDLERLCRKAKVLPEVDRGLSRRPRAFGARVRAWI